MLVGVCYEPRELHLGAQLYHLMCVGLLRCVKYRTWSLCDSVVVGKQRA
jgi:hypothetical protein